MFHADKEKEQKRNNGRNRTIKSGKHQNTWRKRKLKKNLGILEADTIKQTEMKEKTEKMNKKISWNQISLKE